MIQIAGDMRFPGWSGLIRSLQNSLTLEASTSGNVIIGNINNLIPKTDNTQSLGFDFLRWANIHAGSGLFSDMVSLNRAEFSNTLQGNSGSGYALRNENIWYDHLTGNTEAVGVTILTLSMGDLATRPFGVPIADANSVVLADHFTIITSRNVIEFDPNDWYIYLRRTQSDGSVEATSGIVASGQFSWSVSADSVQKTHARWNTSGNIPVEFEPGSCYDVVIHNDGSGVIVAGPAVTLSIGFRINAPASGQGA